MFISHSHSHQDLTHLMGLSKHYAYDQQRQRGNLAMLQRQELAEGIKRLHVMDPSERRVGVYLILALITFQKMTLLIKSTGSFKAARVAGVYAD